MTDLPIRRFRPADADRVRELHEAALRDAGAYVEGVPDEDLDDVAGAYLGEGEFLVGTLDGRVVAIGAYRPVPDRTAARFDGLDRPAAECKRLRVDPAHQRRGFGGAVLAELERRAGADGFDEMVLDVGADQTGARRFYEAAGYECEREVAVESPGGPVALALYRSALEGER